MITTAPESSAATSANSHPRGGLALTLQEAFTATIRLRANRQVAADAGSFRAHIQQLLKAAHQEARRIGYSSADVGLAVYAFVAFLDESVLTSKQPMFDGWSGQPLQAEMFRDHMAGEMFFRRLDELLGQQDSENLADVLEVFQLCMLLGFRGRYGGDNGSLQALISAVNTKIMRIRGGHHEISTLWKLPAEEGVEPARDPWLPRLVAVTAGLFAVALVLFAVFYFLLRSRIATL
jgi:type VI secretion system protein ImpK